MSKEALFDGRNVIQHNVRLHVPQCLTVVLFSTD